MRYVPTQGAAHKRPKGRQEKGKQVQYGTRGLVLAFLLPIRGLRGEKREARKC